MTQPAQAPANASASSDLIIRLRELAGTEPLADEAANAILSLAAIAMRLRDTAHGQPLPIGLAQSLRFDAVTALHDLGL